jgi:hypothetical protein
MLADGECREIVTKLKVPRRIPISARVSTLESDPARQTEDELAEPTPEVLLERVAILVHQRQSLRAGGAGRAALERNRAEITRAQWELSRALIARHYPG